MSKRATPDAPTCECYSETVGNARTSRVQRVTEFCPVHGVAAGLDTAEAPPACRCYEVAAFTCTPETCFFRRATAACTCPPSRTPEELEDVRQERLAELRAEQEERRAVLRASRR